MFDVGLLPKTNPLHYIFMHLEDAFMQNLIHLDTNQCDDIHRDSMMLCVLILPLLTHNGFSRPHPPLWMKMGRSKRSLSFCGYFLPSVECVCLVIVCGELRPCSGSRVISFWAEDLHADLILSLILGCSFIAHETKRQHETAFYNPIINLSTVWDIVEIPSETIKETREIIRVFLSETLSLLKDNPHLSFKTKRYLFTCINLWVGMFLMYKDVPWSSWCLDVKYISIII